jgi:hypothetical protein
MQSAKKVVRLGRFELPTSCFGGTRSIHLSYNRAFLSQRAPSRTRPHIYIMRPGLRIRLVSPHPASSEIQALSGDTLIANEDKGGKGIRRVPGNDQFHYFRKSERVLGGLLHSIRDDGTAPDDNVDGKRGPKTVALHDLAASPSVGSELTDFQGIIHGAIARIHNHGVAGAITVFRRKLAGVFYEFQFALPKWFL